MLSNTYGEVTITNDNWHPTATAQDCLSNYFQYLQGSIDVGSLVPSSPGQYAVVLWTRADPGVPREQPVDRA